MDSCIADPEDVAHSFAKDLKQKLLSRFAFVLDSKHEDFLPVYHVATYLSPHHRFLIDSAGMEIVKDYLTSEVHITDFTKIKNVFP